MQIKTPSSFPTLFIQRLILRQLLERDVNEIFLLRSNPQVNNYLDRQPCDTIEEAYRFIKKINENVVNTSGYYWAIAQPNNNKLIGAICLFDFAEKFKKCEIGIIQLLRVEWRIIKNVYF